jgi:hypothetical protein
MVEARPMIPTTNDFRQQHFFTEPIASREIKAAIALHELDDKSKTSNPRIASCKPAKNSQYCQALLKTRET